MINWSPKRISVCNKFILIGDGDFMFKTEEPVFETVEDERILCSSCSSSK